MNSKSINQLKLQDFQTYPIWEPVDDFEDNQQEVIPCINLDILDLEKIYLLATSYRLADGTGLDGYMRVSWGEVKMLAIGTGNNTFAYFAVGVEDPTGELHQKLAQALKKTREEVFPISFQTQMKFGVSGEKF